MPDHLVSVVTIQTGFKIECRDCGFVGASHDYDAAQQLKIDHMQQVWQPPGVMDELAAALAEHQDELVFTPSFDPGDQLMPHRPVPDAGTPIYDDLVTELGDPR